MTYELHPLCTLFPRLTGAEFDCMTQFTAIRRDRMGIADFKRSEDCPGHWNFKLFDVSAGQQATSRKPIAGEGVALLLDQHGGHQSWSLEPSTPNAREPLSKGRIYFISSGLRGPVKIGWTASPVESRLTELQCGNPAPLFVRHVIEDQSRRDEAALHRRFASLRIRGEWFSAEVLAAVEEVAA